MKETGQKQQTVNEKKLAYQSKFEISSSKDAILVGRCPGLKMVPWEKGY